MGIRRGAARPGVQVGGKSAHAPLLVLVPLGISPGGNVLEHLSEPKLKCGNRDSGRGGYLAVALPAVTSYLVYGPARSGAVGGGWNSEASRQEAGAYWSAQDRIGGAR